MSFIEKQSRLNQVLVKLKKLFRHQNEELDTLSDIHWLSPVLRKRKWLEAINLGRVISKSLSVLHVFSPWVLKCSKCSQYLSALNALKLSSSQVIFRCHSSDLQATRGPSELKATQVPETCFVSTCTFAME